MFILPPPPPFFGGLSVWFGLYGTNYHLAWGQKQPVRGIRRSRFQWSMMMGEKGLKVDIIPEAFRWRRLQTSWICLLLANIFSSKPGLQTNKFKLENVCICRNYWFLKLMQGIIATCLFNDLNFYNRGECIFYYNLHLTPTVKNILSTWGRQKWTQENCAQRSILTVKLLLLTLYHRPPLVHELAGVFAFVIYFGFSNKLCHSEPQGKKSEELDTIASDRLFFQPTEAGKFARHPRMLAEARSVYRHTTIYLGW